MVSISTPLPGLLLLRAACRRLPLDADSSPRRLSCAITRIRPRASGHGVVVDGRLYVHLVRVVCSLRGVSR